MTTAETTTKPPVESRVLVTGGSGFIGTNLIQALRDEGIPVLNLDIVPPRNPAHADVYKQVSLLDAASLARAIEAFAPTCVYHMGARTDLHGQTVGDYPANTTGVRNLMDACRKVPGIQRVLFASSRLVCQIGHRPAHDHEYNATTAYGQSKVEGEEMVRAEPTLPYTWAIVRPTSIWGPWFDIPYRTFFDHVRAGRYFHPGQLKVLKSFGYVGNAVFQMRRIMAAPSDAIQGRTYHIGDYEPIDVKAFADTISTSFGAGGVSSLPTPLLRMAALTGDLMLKLGYKEPPLTTFRLDNLCTNMLHDFWGLDAITGPLPHSMPDGVTRTVAWMREAPQRKGA
jgi:nucleoside-diphosphate-sugar epimerase